MISLIVCGKFKLIAFCVCFEKEINSVKFKKLESLLLVYVDKLYLFCALWMLRIFSEVKKEHFSIIIWPIWNIKDRKLN